MKKIILNRIQTPDGTILTSYSVHDYKTHIDKNGLEYMVDGGNEYLRRNEHKNHPYKESSVYSNSSFKIIRQSFFRGTRGKKSNEPLHYIPLCEMSNEHIINTINYILFYRYNIKSTITDIEIDRSKEIILNKIKDFYIDKIYYKELEYRKKKGILFSTEMKMWDDASNEDLSLFDKKLKDI